MIECTDCGARNAGNATFCVRCGAELGQTDERTVIGEDTDRLEPVADETVPGSEEAVSADEEIAASEPVDDDAEPVDEDVAELLRDASKLLAAGKADEAAARCRDAIVLAPDLVAAYSLLGMAEEQRGNTVAAAGAYRRVLQLDPERRVEREKLELLHAGGAATGVGESRASEDSASPIIRYAPWVAAVGAAFLVLMILTGVGWRSHLHRQAERAFIASVESGTEALDRGDYQAALQAFESALEIRPEDGDAQQGLRYARRKLTTASGTASGPSMVQPMPHSATLLPSRGPNPFQPIPIGPAGETQAQDGLEPQPRQPAQQSAPRPPVVTPERVTGAERRSPTTGAPSTEAVPFGPLEVADEPVATPAPDRTPRTADAEHEQPEQTPEPKRRGEISIWISEAPPESQPERVEASAPAPSTEHADRARSLRGSADQARRQGNSSRAVELYDQAIESYRQDIQQNPSNRAANEAAIAACERARALSRAEEQ